jgi:hypothetical protein
LIAFKDCRDVEISHCTIADNVLKSGKQAILLFSDSAGDVFNTILLNPGFPEIAVEGESDLVVYCSDIEGGYPGEGNISSDPLFARDYHLSQCSPCRDRGCPEEAPEEDWDNDYRPFGPGYDIGADECLLPYVSPGTGASFTPPPFKPRRRQPPSLKMSRTTTTFPGTPIIRP